MSNLNEIFLNELTTALYDKFDVSSIETIRLEVAKVLDNYKLEKDSKELIVYDNFPTMFRDYLVVRKIEGLAKSSLELYESVFKDFVRTIGKPIDNLCANDIRLWLENMQLRKGCQNRYKDLIRSILSTFFKWANCEGYIPSNPCLAIKPIKYVRHDKGFLTDTQVEQIISSCKNIRDRAIVELMISTGCRVSELINIKLQDINFDARTIKIIGKGNKQRYVYYNARAEETIKNYLATRNDKNEYLFSSSWGENKGLSKSAVEKIMRQLEQETGIEVYPHKFRHTMATMCAKKGMPVQDIQKLLGHSNISTTMIYASISDDNVKQSHQKYAF